ncbi:MAG: hypothetical protein NC115_03425 [Bacteroidales bacterium]|nr:hypothetical protein [Bacteroides sp.]MCM1198857.1 hypothetical protein [Clostridium sp.]MCM1501703.1 hypothetical protein [Bacteroidales bacterium]
MYSKIIKLTSWALLIAGVVIGVLGFVIGFTTNDAVAVDVLLYWAYAMVGLTLAAIVVVGIIIGAMTNPKGLVKTGAVVLGFAALVAIAYAVAPGSEAVGIVGTQPSTETLKITDTVLILTYLSCAAAVAAVIVGSIVGAIRK